MATVGRGADQYTVRFPDGLRDRIKVAADENNRSMNAEIVATLEEKYPKPNPISLSERMQMITLDIAEMPIGEERDQLWSAFRESLLEMADRVLSHRRKSGNMTSEEEAKLIERRKKIAESDISDFDLDKLRKLRPTS